MELWAPVQVGTAAGILLCRMGLFEENPWLLIPIIILTSELWSALKAFVRSAIEQRRSARTN